VSIGRSLLIVFTLAIFLLGAFSLLVQPLPVWIPTTLGVTYLILLGVGALNMRLEMFGPALRHGPTDRPQIALTFDDGPDPVSTPLVLSLLKSKGAKATFFVIGKKAALYPELLRQILREGHSLGLHGFDHNRLYALLPPHTVERDIERCQDALKVATGLRSLWFRPPIGQLSPRTAKGIELAGVEAVAYSARARDGAPGAKVQPCLERVKKTLAPGAIVLLHDAWERKEVPPLAALGPDVDPSNIEELPVGVRLLPHLLEVCAARGLACVTLEELVAASHDAST
jgi:peptidoglycan/xylan/chitin deacetylase (PgdA/CDA1 family)